MNTYKPQKLSIKSFNASINLSEEDIIDLILKDDDIKEFVKKNNMKRSQIKSNVKEFYTYYNEKNNLKENKNSYFKSLLKYDDGNVSLVYDYNDSYKELSNDKIYTIINDSKIKNIKQKFDKKLTIGSDKLIEDLNLIIKKNNKNNFLYIYGSKKCGKSFLCTRFFKKFISVNEQTGIYADSYNKIDLLNTFSFDDNKKFKELLKQFSECGLLILDDFEYSNLNEYKKDNILIPILKNRIDKNLLTIIISGKNVDASFGEFNLKNNTNNLLYELINDNFKEYELKGPVPGTYE